MMADIYKSDIDRHLFAPAPRMERRGKPPRRRRAWRSRGRAFAAGAWLALLRELRAMAPARILFGPARVD